MKYDHNSTSSVQILGNLWIVKKRGVWMHSSVYIQERSCSVWLLWASVKRLRSHLPEFEFLISVVSGLISFDTP